MKKAHYSINNFKEFNIHSVEDLVSFCKKNNVPDSLNWVLLSTSGVHGSYLTLDDNIEYLKDKTNEKWEDYEPTITAMIFAPRMVRVIYGTLPFSEDEEEMLKEVDDLRDIVKRTLEFVNQSQSGNT